jgi:membrane-bound lytic murein transglycosylase D
MSPEDERKSRRAPVEEAEAGAVYRARSGDTLAKIARAKNLPLGQLLRLNPQAAKALHPGDAVRLPGGAAPAAATVRTHVVQKGETLAAIARKYGVDSNDLKVWNGLKGDRIEAGRRLRLAPR